MTGTMKMKHIYFAPNAAWTYELLDVDLYIWGFALGTYTVGNVGGFFVSDQIAVLFNDPTNALSYTSYQAADIEGLMAVWQISNRTAAAQEYYNLKPIIMLPKPIFYSNPKVGMFISPSDSNKCLEVYYEEAPRGI